MSLKSFVTITVQSLCYVDTQKHSQKSAPDEMSEAKLFKL